MFKEWNYEICKIFKKNLDDTLTFMAIQHPTKQIHTNLRMIFNRASPTSFLTSSKLQNIREFKMILLIPVSRGVAKLKGLKLRPEKKTESQSNHKNLIL